MRCAVLLFIGLGLLAALGDAQAWTKRRGSKRANKIVDVEENHEVDPATFGNFAALNEQAKAQGAAKKPRRSEGRRSRRGSSSLALPTDGAASMEALMSQMAGGGMAELMKGLGGGGDLTELMKGLGEGLGGEPTRPCVHEIYIYRESARCRSRRTAHCNSGPLFDITWEQISGKRDGTAITRS
jgi:hypothetical protein